MSKRTGGSLSVREFCGNKASDHTSGHANGPLPQGATWFYWVEILLEFRLSGGINAPIRSPSATHFKLISWSMP